MNKNVEDKLRQGMAAFGKLIERVIGKAKDAKVTVAKTRPGSVEPILALESQLPISKLKDIISVSIDRMLKAEIPNLVDKAAVEISEGESKFAPIMKEKGAAVSLHVDIGSAAGTYPRDKKTKRIHNIRALSHSIPFEDGFFDYTIANLATPSTGDVVRVIKEIGRIITIGGYAIIIDFHPFGRFAKKGSQRLRGMESVVRGVEDYYKICGLSGFNLEYVREAFFDETLRTMFATPEEKTVFRTIKDTPFLIFVLAKKKGM